MKKWRCWATRRSDIAWNSFGQINWSLQLPSKGGVFWPWRRCPLETIWGDSSAGFRRNPMRCFRNWGTRWPQGVVHQGQTDPGAAVLAVLLRWVQASAAGAAPPAAPSGLPEPCHECPACHECHEPKCRLASGQPSCGRIDDMKCFSPAVLTGMKSFQVFGFEPGGFETRRISKTRPFWAMCAVPYLDPCQLDATQLSIPAPGQVLWSKDLKVAT